MPEAKTKIIEIEMTLKQTWICNAEDDLDEPIKFMKEYLRVRNGQGECALAEDYGRGAWGGYDGPILMQSELV